VRRLVRGQIVSADVGVCNDRPFLLWAGIGLDAMSIQKLEPRPRFEKFISVPVYAAQTIWNASVWSGQNMTFDIDGKQMGGHFQLAVINNIRTYLGGMAVLSPDAHLDDGEMDLWLFKGSNLGDAFRHAFGMMSGRHLTSPDAERIPFRHLTIESDMPLMVQTDGDPAGISYRTHFSVLPGALRLFVPQQSLRLFKHAASGAGKSSTFPLFPQL
jgi:diacylglycerol kinase family enzyme